MTCDMWHVIRDMWHMTCDIWYVSHGGGWKYPENFSSVLDKYIYFRQMNNRIYLWPWTLANICTNEYQCLKIHLFVGKYLNIFHTLFQQGNVPGGGPPGLGCGWWVLVMQECAGAPCTVHCLYFSEIQKFCVFEWICGSSK